MKIFFSNNNPYQYSKLNNKNLQKSNSCGFIDHNICFKKHLNLYSIEKRARTDELLQLTNFAPCNKKLFERISSLIPEKSNNFLAIASILTPFNNLKLDSTVVDKYFELYSYNKELFSEKTPKDIAEYTINSFKIDTKNEKLEFLPNVMCFVKENLEDKNLNKILTLCKSFDNTEVDSKKLILFQKLSNNYIPFQFIEKALKSPLSTRDEFNDFFKKAVSLTNDHNDAINLTEIALEKELPIEYYEILYKKSIERKGVLEIYGEQVSEEDVKKLLFNNPRNTSNTIEFLGENTFYYSFIDKYQKVEEYIKDFGNIKQYPHYEAMLEIINPENSIRFKNAKTNIVKLKKGFNDKTKTEQNEIIKELNKNNAIIRNLLNRSIKDPQKALDVAIIYKTLCQNETKNIGEIIQYFNPQNKEEKEKLQKILNIIILEKMEDIEDNKIKYNRIENIDFTQSKYLASLFNSSKEFNEGLRIIFKFIEKYPDKSFKEIADILPQNIITRELFEKNNIDYDKWVNFNPTSFINRTLFSDVENTRTNTIKNLQDNLNNCIWAYIPLNVINELDESLISKGYTLKDVSLNANPERKIYKINGKPIEYTDLKPIINVIISEFINKDFWKKTQFDADTDNAKQEIKRRFLGDINNEIKKIDFIKHTKDKTLELKIQKANMNSIEKSLFLGNDAGGCCSSVGKTRDWTAPYYVINKMISCIEVLDSNDHSIGNTMCYIAKIDNKLSLILDNIELKSEYEYNETIRDSIFEYAERLCEEIGNPDMPIYVAGNNNKVHLDKYPRYKKEFYIIGSTGDTEIYLDFNQDRHKVDPKEKHESYLYKIR